MSDSGPGLLTLRPIGIIHSPFNAQSGTPIQSVFTRRERATVEVFEEFAPGLKDVEGFDYLILVYGFHLSKEYDLEVIPYMDSVKRGLFATRAPRRPNPIGLSVVRLVERQGRRLIIEQFDMLDDTPLYDIKPYVPLFDGGREGCRVGWLKDRARREESRRADDRFEENRGDIG